MHRSVLVTLPLILLSACTAGVGMTDNGPSPDMQICAKSGGFLDTRGRRGTLMCVHPYTDAGKSCSSSNDCQGKCIARSSATDSGLPKDGSPVAGQCQPDDRLFGCYAEVEGGKARAAICVD